jgi:phosphoglycolate phosphatase
MSELRSLVIFDLDGTLVDSRQDLTTAVNLMRRSYSLPPLPIEVVSAMVGNGIRNLVRRSLGPSLSQMEIDLKDAVSRTAAAYADHLLDSTRPYPGVAQTLADVRSMGYKIAVATNKPEAPSRRILMQLGLLPMIACVVGGDSCPALKPDPGPLLLALERTGCTRARSWMVGDNYTDLAAGRGADLDTAFCRYGFGNIGTETPSVELERIDDILPFLA